MQKLPGQRSEKTPHRWLRQKRAGRNTSIVRYNLLNQHLIRLERFPVNSFDSAAHPTPVTQVVWFRKTRPTTGLNLAVVGGNNSSQQMKGGQLRCRPLHHWIIQFSAPSDSSFHQGLWGISLVLDFWNGKLSLQCEPMLTCVCLAETWTTVSPASDKINLSLIYLFMCARVCARGGYSVSPLPWHHTLPWKTEQPSSGTSRSPRSDLTKKHTVLSRFRESWHGRTSFRSLIFLQAIFGQKITTFAAYNTPCLVFTHLMHDVDDDEIVLFSLNQFTNCKLR